MKHFTECSQKSNLLEFTLVNCVLLYTCPAQEFLRIHHAKFKTCAQKILILILVKASCSSTWLANVYLTQRRSDYKPISNHRA